MSQTAIFAFGVAVFFLGGLGMVLIGLDAFRSWSRDDIATGEPAFRAAEAARAEAREDTGRSREREAGEGAAR